MYPSPRVIDTRALRDLSHRSEAESAMPTAVTNEREPMVSNLETTSYTRIQLQATAFRAAPTDCCIFEEVSKTVKSGPCGKHRQNIRFNNVWSL